MQTATWGDTLLPFLASSGEDASYELFFEREFRDFVRPLIAERRHITWQEIGAGPGTKTRKLLRSLASYVSSVRLEVIERDPLWLPLLYDGAFIEPRPAAVSYEFWFCWFEEYRRFEETNQRPKGDIQLVTAFHLFYDSSLVEELADYVAEHPTTLFVLTCENRESDLSALRREVSQRFSIPCARSYLKDLAEHRNVRKREIRMEPLIQKKLRVTDSGLGTEHQPGWFLPFLLGIGMDQYMALDVGLRRSYADELRRRLDIGPFSSKQFDIPDDVLVVYPKASNAFR